MSNHNDLNRNALTFIAGAAAGGLAALLLAPMKGSELRERIGEEADTQRQAAGRKLQDISKRTGEQWNEISARAGETARDLSAKASDTYERSRERTGEAFSRTKEAASGTGSAVANALRAGLDAFEKTLNG